MFAAQQKVHCTKHVSRRVKDDVFPARSLDRSSQSMLSQQRRASPCEFWKFFVHFHICRCFIVTMAWITILSMWCQSRVSAFDMSSQKLMLETYIALTKEVLMVDEKVCHHSKDWCTQQSSLSVWNCSTLEAEVDHVGRCRNFSRLVATKQGCDCAFRLVLVDDRVDNMVQLGRGWNLWPFGLQFAIDD
jgi:hypothetical protein